MSIAGFSFGGWQISKRLLPLEVALANQARVILSIVGYSFEVRRTSKQSFPLEVALADQAVAKAITPVRAEKFKCDYNYKLIYQRTKKND